MNHKFIKLTKVTDCSHLNLYLAEYQLKDKVLKYQFATRRKEKMITINTNNHNYIDAVKILPYTEKNGELFLVLIKEFRHALNNYLYSLPAGLVDENECPVDAARRELKEEIGAETLSIELTAKNSYTSMGLTDESIECYTAKVNLVHLQELDDCEDIEVVLVPLKEAEIFLKENFTDVVTLLMTQNFMLKNKLNS